MIVQFFGQEANSCFEIASSDKLYLKQFGNKIAYASIKPLEINLICPEKTTKNLNLTERGILDLYPNCTVSSPYFTLNQKYMNSKIVISKKVERKIHTRLSHQNWHEKQAITPIKPLLPIEDQFNNLSHQPHLNILVMAKYGFAIIATILCLITLTIIVLFCLYSKSPVETDV